MNTQIYKFQCNGAKSITQAPSSTEKLSVTYRVSSIDVGVVQSGDPSKAYPLLRTLNSGLTIITMTKQY